MLKHRNIVDENGEFECWFVWILIICGCVYGFYYIDNEWLE